MLPNKLKLQQAIRKMNARLTKTGSSCRGLGDALLLYRGSRVPSSGDTRALYSKELGDILLRVGEIEGW
ncbi:UNVERIFIED_CONTAM: hypothetical protein Sindi_0031200, partial [Sesamum indicum]